MADDPRFRDDRSRQQGYGQPPLGQGQLGPGQFANSGYGQGGPNPSPYGGRQQGEGGYAQQGQPQHEQNQYGQAGGYTRMYGEGPQGQRHNPYAGQQEPRGFQGERSFEEPRSYTGQTGTGYGYSPGGGAFQGAYEAERPDAGDHQSLWDKTKTLLTGGGRQEGPHRGRGPKSYSRSDERIQDDVNDRLTDDPFLDASHVEVGVAGGEVTLSGVVSSRADKRRAEDLADNVSGVKHVQNNLRVESAATTGASSSAAGETYKPS